jgi:PAS domain S-box-containing protein
MLRILVIDDNPDDRTLAIRELKRAFSDFQVEQIIDLENFHQALDAGEFDLAITDYQLGWSNGLTVLHSIKARYPERPVIMFTSSGSEEVAVEAMKAGLDDYVLKSCKHYIRLATAVRSAWERAKTQLIVNRLELERQQAEAELRKANERFTLAAAAVNSMIYDWHIQQNWVERTQGLTKVLGYRQDETEPTHDWWLARIHPDDRQRTREEFREALANEKNFTIEYRVRHKNNQYLYVWDRGVIVRDAEGVAVRVVGSTLDITDRKQLEESLRQQAEELAQANRLKDDFLAIVSHELRTPLNSILGWVQLLRSRKLAEKKTALALETIERNAKLQTQLIEDLLDISRLMRGQIRLNMRPQDLASVIEAAVDSVRPTAETKAISIESAIALDVGVISGDSDRLQQILWNLLANALKFTPNGGRVKVRLRSIISEPISRPYAQIQVSDTGKGIKPEFLPYVFDRFRQGENASTRSSGGMGLGLAIVRQLVELHGGSVQADSPGEGQGATFTVQLPLMDGQLSVVGAYCHTRVPNPHQTLNGSTLDGLQVLVVDDEADTREVITTVLEEYGAKVTVAASVSEALETLQQLQPDVLVSDIGMPGEDGYTLISKVTKEAQGNGKIIPSVALTAYARESDRQRAIAAGFQMHVSKPIEPAELVAVVTRLVGID